MEKTEKPISKFRRQQSSGVQRYSTGTVVHHTYFKIAKRENFKRFQHRNKGSVFGVMGMLSSPI